MEISNDVSAEEANQQIELSAARLNLDGNSKARELNECERDALRWLAEATEDLEQRRLIFGDKSMDKLIEFGHVLQWIGWLREEFEKADRLAAELTRAELQRQPADSDKAKPRWRFKVRLHSGSHTVGHRALATWNDRGSWIKLIQVSGKQHELLVEMTFPSTLVIQNLYFAGWGAIRRFVVALNIGSLGFFWWYVPQQVSRFYEQLTDLESDSKLELDYSPRLVLDWKREGLSEIDLRNTAVCFGFLPYPDDAAECVPLNHYIMGLTWLSKSDIHLQLELDVFREFYLAMKTTYELNRADLTVESFEQLADKLFNNSDEGKKFQELASRVISGSAERKDITLREAGIMKLLADAQLLSRCQQLAALKKT
jgi:hypothetical protein